MVLLLAVALVLPSSGATAGVPGKQQWLADVRAAMAGSHRHLDARVDRGGRRLAVNLDIDNTALASRFDPGHAVGPVLRFARHARRHRVALLFNTARLRGDGRLRRVERTLERAGYDVARVCGRRAGETRAHSKQRCRREFVDDGYRIIVNIGNRRTDFVGRHYERGYRLPSYHGALS